MLFRSGKCSLTAAIPVISVMGVQAVPLPTAVLSNQTGYPSYYCDDYTEHMGQIMDEWEKRGFSPDGIYTGFLADEEIGRASRTPPPPPETNNSVANEWDPRHKT